MTPERKEIEFWTTINEVPPFIKECNIDWDKLVSDYKEEKEKENDILFKEENNKYLKALNGLTDSDVTEFENNGILPSSITSIVTMGADLRFYFKKMPNKTPSTGGYVFDDISKAYVETNEG